jgi:hypothetical protein
MASILKRKEPHIWTGSPHKDDGKKILTITLDNGVKLPLRFKPEVHDPEAGAMVQLGDFLATLNPQQSANLIEQKIKQQYDVSTLALASAAVGEFADGASFGIANWLGSHMAAAVGVGEGDYDARLQQARDSARVERTQAQSQFPNTMALAEGTGVAANPLMAHPLIKAVGKTVKGASAAPRVDYGVLNPALVAHPGRLASIGEAAGKGGLWGYAANAINNDTGEINIDPASARSGAEFAGGIQGLLNAAGPVGRLLSRAVPRSERPAPTIDAISGENAVDSNNARLRLLSAHKGNSLRDSLFGTDIDPTAQLAKAHDDALLGGVDSFGNTSNIPSLMGSQAENLAVGSANIAPVSGQRVMDQERILAAQQAGRLNTELGRTANVPSSRLYNLEGRTAEQSMNLRNARVERTSGRRRDEAYPDQVPLAGSINSLKTFRGWNKIYENIRGDRAAQVGGSQNPLPKYDPNTGMPNELPKSFNDFVDSFRYIPVRQYNTLSAKHGGDLPFERVKADKKFVKVTADGTKSKNPRLNTHYKVKLNERTGDIRTMHSLRKDLDTAFGEGGDLQRISGTLKEETRHSINNLIKQSPSMRKHDAQIHNTKEMEEAVKRGAAAVKSTTPQRAELAGRRYRTNPDTNFATRNDQRRLFRQSFLDIIRGAGVTVKDITSGRLGELKEKLELVFDGLPKNDKGQIVAYNDFLAKLGREKASSGLSSRLGEKASAVDVPSQTENTKTKILRLTAKVPAYMFSKEFGMQRDFMESWKTLLKTMTKGEASAINRISALRPGTPEYASEMKKLQGIYLKTKQVKKFRTAQNIGAFMAESVHEHDENYALMSQAGPRHSRTDQQERKINPATRAAESILDAAGDYGGDIWNWLGDATLKKRKRPQSQ